MASKHKYNNDSIDLMLGADRIRKRPASMLGDNGLSGARHGITEILGNALDEASVGYGNKLDVKFYKNGAISIRDYGRGVPLGWNEKRKNYNWHIIYNELYGGGKYDNGQWYLRSVDNWSIWDDTDKDLLSNFFKDTGVDLLDVPTDGEEYAYGDITVKRRNNKIYLRVNNASWSSITWDFLNNRLNYLASVGLNGLGASATQYTSEFFTVRSYRDGVCTEMNFKKGIPIINGEPLNVFLKNYDMKEFPPTTYDTDEENGTYIYWKPDDEVFTSTDIGGDWLLNTLRDVSYVTGLELHYEDESTGQTVDIEGGDLKGLVLHKYGKNLRCMEDSDIPVLFNASKFGHGSTRVEGKDFVWVLKVDTVFGAVTGRKNENYCYHNSIKMQGGAQYYGVDNAIADFFNELAKVKGLKLAPDDYDNTFGVCVSSYSNFASFRGQTKDEVTDGFIQDAVYSTVYDTLKVEFNKGNKLIETVIDEVFERAERRILLREQAKLTKEANKVKKLKKPDKFVTCKAYEKKQYDKAELWIAEGDSANTSLKEARDNNFQALFPIRGKSLNVLKASIEKILANQEIKSIFALLGTGYDLGFDDNPFDISKLRFNKIIFATDADEDGYQIRVLLYLIFYRLAPELLRQGHVYIAETPRFEIVFRDGSKEYALDDRERDEIIKNNAGRISKINRFKGLGEVNSDVLRNTTVAPEHRHLIRLSCNFQNETERNLIDALFGADKYNQRKAMLTAVLGGNVADMIEENALLLEEIENSEIEEEVEYEVVQ